jgi:hypothetical protein
MSGTLPPPPFLAPLLGLTLLFAALGPPFGGAMFVTLAVLPKPPLAGSALAAALLGHGVMPIAACLVGVGPAMATGLIYALFDAAAPQRWPRALAAAAIGAALTHAFVFSGAIAGLAGAMAASLVGLTSRASPGPADGKEP